MSIYRELYTFIGDVYTDIESFRRFKAIGMPGLQLHPALKINAVSIYVNKRLCYDNNFNLNYNLLKYLSNTISF
jgi:hypothetical protein